MHPRALPIALAACGLAASAHALPTDFQVSTPLDTFDANVGDGVCADLTGLCSLRAAIMEANARGGVTTIRLQLGATYLLTLVGPGEDGGVTGDLDVSGQISLLGRGATVDALGLDRAFDVHSGGALRAASLTVRGGRLQGESGGGFRNTGVLSLTRSSVIDCRVTGAGASGGGVFNDGGEAILSGVDVRECEAERAGGAVEANGGTTTIACSTFEQNSAGPAPGNGGGLHLTGPGLVLVDASAVTRNAASNEGGGLWNSSTGTMTVTATRIADDSAPLGPEVFNDGGRFTLDGTAVPRD